MTHAPNGQSLGLMTDFSAETPIIQLIKCEELLLLELKIGPKLLASSPGHLEPTRHRFLGKSNFRYRRKEFARQTVSLSS